MSSINGSALPHLSQENWYQCFICWPLTAEARQTEQNASGLLFLSSSNKAETDLSLASFRQHIVLLLVQLYFVFSYAPFFYLFFLASTLMKFSQIFF
jgi:hypothetical protein